MRTPTRLIIFILASASCSLPVVAAVQNEPLQNQPPRRWTLLTARHNRIQAHTLTSTSLTDQPLALDQLNLQDTLALFIQSPLLSSNAASPTPSPTPLPAPHSPPPDDAWGGTATTTDGQSFTGWLVKQDPISPDDSEPAIIWHHPLLGALTIPLDNLASLTATGTQTDSSNADQDFIVLSNSDTITGFIESINHDIIIEHDNNTSTIPLSSIVSLHLANPQTPPANSRLWLNDGSNFTATITYPNATTLSINPSLSASKTPSESDETNPESRIDNTSITLSLDQIIALVPDAKRIVPLSSQLVQSYQPVEPLFWSAPPAIHTDLQPFSRIDLPGPIDVRWTLPPGTLNLFTTIDLAPADRDWGNCQAQFFVQRADQWLLLHTLSLSADQPEHQITLDLAGDAQFPPTALRIRILPGKFGPIKDRPRLLSPLLIINAGNT